MIGLASGESRNPVLLLDAEPGVVYWPECFSGLTQSRGNPFKTVQDDAYEYAVENEADWRADYCWEIGTFFEMLKHQYRILNFVPLSETAVLDDFHSFSRDQHKEILEMARYVYQKHGWPDMELYDKDNCLAAMKEAMDEKVFLENFGDCRCMLRFMLYFQMLVWYTGGLTLASPGLMSCRIA